MTFKKLALAAAIAAVPAVAFSVETLDDSELSATTGRDGLEVSIQIANNISTDIYLHDTDGLDAGFSGYSFDGAIIIDDMQVGAGTIGLEIDAGDRATSANAPILNISVTLPATLTIATGDILVANSQVDNGARNYDGTPVTILENMNIILGGTTLNIQLGNEEQTGTNAGSDMAVLSGSITGGVTISNFRVNDANSGGGIGMSSMTVTDSAGANLTLNVDVNVTAAGLELDLAQVGDGGGMRIEIIDQYLGSTTAGTIGDISVVGLNLNDTKIVVSGK